VKHTTWHHYESDCVGHVAWYNFPEDKFFGKLYVGATVEQKQQHICLIAPKLHEIARPSMDE
jgi:hypothetical protein